MDFLRAGIIVRPHGVKGMVKIMPLTADAKRFFELDHVFIEKDKQYSKKKITSCGVRTDSVYLGLENVSSKNDAECLVNLYVCVERENAVALNEYEYFVADLIGCEVFDTNGKRLGILTDVLETGANDVYEIRGEKLLYVPALKKVIDGVFAADKRIVLNSEVLSEVGLYED